VNIRTGSYDERYKFTGYEKDEESGLSYMGARYYNSIWGVETSSDAYWWKSPHESSYVHCGNNPIMFYDPDGNYAVSVHYRITYNALTTFGYKASFSDKVAHMASVYADHPPKGVLKIDNIAHNTHHNYKPNVDYTPTELSQKEFNSTWHSMMSNAEMAGGMTHAEAKNRGLEFGWNNIFAQKNGFNEGTFGQGLHALQDAYAHQGASTNEHLGVNASSVEMFHNDMFGSTLSAEFITTSAITVFSLLRGNSNGTGLSNGMKLDFSGMSTSQLQETSGLFKGVGYQLYNTNMTGIYTIYKIEE
jgi:RHS repeat-associated protein